MKKYIVTEDQINDLENIKTAGLLSEDKILAQSIDKLKEKILKQEVK